MSKKTTITLEKLKLWYPELNDNQLKKLSRYIEEYANRRAEKLVVDARIDELETLDPKFQLEYTGDRVIALRNQLKGD